ncbi:hypothetical protein BGZ60DRAFT_528950 [Tricladium varicosporioides]|nr:hypothetical protein BGZ60DRAFT_528950 [Hymenoscyphus varicosporioides]
MSESERSKVSVANFVLQLLAIGLAVLFGVYTALAYPLTKSSLQQAQIANQLTLLSLCASDTNGNEFWRSPCSEAMKRLNLTKITNTLVPPTPTPSSQKSLSNSDKIAIAVGLGFGLPSIIASVVPFYARMYRRHV